MPALGQRPSTLFTDRPIVVNQIKARGQREQWFLRGRTLPGQSPAALRFHAEQQKLALREARIAARANLTQPAQPHSPTLPGAVWVPLGPAPLASDASGIGSQDYGPVSGRATAVAIDPADTTGNTVFIGGAYGGIWRSTNAGSASQDPSQVVWTPIGDDLLTLAIGAIAIQPGNADPTKSVVIVGTGEANSSVDSYYGLGILRSMDAGSTWEAPISQAATGQSLLGLGFSRIAFSTANPNIVVAGTTATAHGYSSGLESPSAVNRGLYYSTDGGEIWSFAVPSDGGTAITPESATSVIYNSAAGLFFAAVRFHGFYSSSDGATWTRLTNQPGSALSVANCPNVSSANCPIYRGEIAVVPGREEMYVWYVDANSADQGIWQSKDGGVTWMNINDSGVTNCGDPFGGCGTAQGFYDLELAAVPNGSTATDLYAGAENIYKCQINSAQPACSGTGPNTFLNLTHVYGCPPDFGSIAHVHPDQHAVDFMIADGKDEMYFANDGGIYRALDGFTGLTAGDCGGSNQFDSLNQTLGSMMQFVSFSVHPSDPNTILGGTQDNGSPATSSAESSTAWESVNGGDGGYNAINPNDPLEWFTANTDVSIQRCTNGAACHTQDFLPIVEPATLGGDHGDFYTPYILDPQYPTSELIVGTCRVWRGPGAGGSFSQLSNSFETGSGGCTGTEINMVRALAAGGAPDSNGFSNLIYAGTDGGAATPGGGHVWITTDAADGPSTWTDRTDNVNPSGYPISSITLDPTDPSGHTAYVTVMGFHVSHVWKTTNAGVSWADFTGTGLPDAPANTVVVDGQSGTMYVGTDVGVFSSSVSSPAWTEVGPIDSPSGAGFLPDVAVTALRIFNGGGVKELRASTYGRGVWEIRLATGADFQFNIPISLQNVFSGQTATFSGTVNSLNGYNAQVALTCIAGTTAAPSNCSVSPATLTPSSAGTPFTATAGGAIGDYAFQIHGAGNDSNATTRLAPLALHVVDFALGAPAPTSITVPHGTTSQPVNFQVSASGSFSGTVQLSCSGLPTGATCTFSPSANVTPTSSAPVNVNVAVAVPASAATGTSTITIIATVNGAPAAKTQAFSLSVALNPDFAITLPSPFPNVTTGSTAGAPVSITAQDGFSGTVALSCSPSCSVSPATASSYPASPTITVDATNLTAGNYSMTVVGASASLSHSLTIPFVVSAVTDFTISATPSSQQVAAGQSAQYDVVIGPSNYNSPVLFTMSCQSATCSLSCMSVTPSAGGCGTSSQPAVLTVLTPSASAVRHGLLTAKSTTIILFGFVALTLPFPRSRFVRKRGKILSFLICALLLSLSTIIACGGGLSGNSIGTVGDPPGTTQQQYELTIQASSGSITKTAQVSLIVE